MKSPYEILRHPILSEKASSLARKRNVHPFAVDIHATKSEIKQAIQAVYNVKVKQVRTLRVKGKSKRMRNMLLSGRRKDWKKAYVTLAEGHRLDII